MRHLQSVSGHVSTTYEDGDVDLVMDDGPMALSAVASIHAGISSGRMSRETPPPPVYCLGPGVSPLGNTLQYLTLLFPLRRPDRHE